MTCGTGVCGTGGYTGPQPGDPDGSNVAVSASPAFGGIDVTWTYPAINPQAVAHMELYRGIVNNSGAAFLIAIVNGNTYFDKLNTGLTYYYWVKVVSVHGTVGGFIGPAAATARPRIATLIEDLSGQIDDGVLAPSLKSTLDQISTLNANLAQEVLDRENGQTSFGQALADVQVGVAEAHTFIANEIATRVTANSAMAEQIQLTAATLGSDIAAVSIKADAWIDPVEGIGAQWNAQVTVNGLVGGFGVYNDGSTVEAGFDTDKFWVGKTNANKRKPFIIDGATGETYIDNAVIRELSADHIDSRGLDVRDINGNVILSAGGQLSSNAFINLDGNNVSISDIAAGNLVPSLNFVGTYAAAPSEVQVGGAWRQNALYKNSTDSFVYVLTGSPLSWVLYLADGMSFVLTVSSSNGTVFRVGGGTTTTISARLFKNGAEVTEQVAASAFKWTRVSMIPRLSPYDDYSWNMAHATGYKAFVLSVDDVYAKATFFCEVNL